MSEIQDQEVIQLQNYLRRTFGTDRLRLMKRKETSDSVEVLLGDEFLALIYKNVEEGETSYDLNMSILDIDIEPSAA